MARRCCGPYVMAGKSLSWLAPAWIAVNASVAVPIPGITCIPSCRARSITADVAVRCDDETSACLVSAINLVRMQHGPGTDQAVRAMRFCEQLDARNGSGELSGTSMMPMPASCSARPVSDTRSGVTPRRMATSPDARPLESGSMHRLPAATSGDARVTRPASDAASPSMARPARPLRRERGGIEARDLPVRRRCGPACTRTRRECASAPRRSLADHQAGQDRPRSPRRHRWRPAGCGLSNIQVQQPGIRLAA